MTVISLHNAEHYLWGGSNDGWHLVKSPEMSVIQERVQPGGQEVRHYHHHSRQFFFVLSGEAVLEINGEKHTLHAQQGVEVPPGVPHQMLNEAAEEVIFLVISVPPSHGDRVNL